MGWFICGRRLYPLVLSCAYKRWIRRLSAVQKSAFVIFVLFGIIYNFPASPTNLAAWALTITFVRQDGTGNFDSFQAAVPTGDGSAVLAGVTFGSWNGTNAGSGDFAAVKLDTNGTVDWRWQVSEELDSPGPPSSLNSLESSG